MTGALKSTAINDMETITRLESMGERREVKQVIQLEKMKRLQHHPMRERVTTGTKSRLKRLSFLHKAKRSQNLEIPAQDRPEPMNTTSATPWSMQKKPEIRDSIEEVGTKKQVHMEQLTHLTQKYIEHYFPSLSPRFFAKKNLKFCIQNAKFCKLKRQILQKFCNVFTQPNFFLCNANTTVTHPQSPIFFLIKCRLLKNNISLMEVDLYILRIMSTHRFWLQFQSELMAAMNI